MNVEVERGSCTRPACCVSVGGIIIGEEDARNDCVTPGVHSLGPNNTEGILGNFSACALLEETGQKLEDVHELNCTLQQWKPSLAS